MCSVKISRGSRIYQTLAQKPKVNKKKKKKIYVEQVLCHKVFDFAITSLKKIFRTILLINLYNNKVFPVFVCLIIVIYVYRS